MSAFAFCRSVEGREQLSGWLRVNTKKLVPKSRVSSFATTEIMLLDHSVTGVSCVQISGL
jgi:hypothetical protein